jgi:hypothetical protein
MLIAVNDAAIKYRFIAVSSFKSTKAVARGGSPGQ